MLAAKLLISALLSLVQADETVLGAFIFHRHGDRTAKFWPPAKLTDLGYSQVYQAGIFYRNRYISGSEAIAGISKDIVKLSQLSVESPVDIVLQATGIGWLQGLYPPVGPSLGSQALANGTTIEAPMDGYQLIPINGITSATSSSLEDTVWLQGSSGCANAIASSNNYFISQEYLQTLAQTNQFYQNIYPVVNGSFPSSYCSYKNAYAIYDLINVASYDNTTINSSSLLTNEVFPQLRTLANQHEYGLAYNASEPIRAIAGATLAAQILQQLNLTLSSSSAPKLAVQFGTYASYLAFFGLAQLPKVSVNFTGIVDYASSMAFELITNGTVTSTSNPPPDQVSVRFLFSNGSAAVEGLTAYPLFGQSQIVLPWSTFVSEMNKIAIGDQKTWCVACGNTTGTCAAYQPSPTASSSPAATSSATPSPTDSGSDSSSSISTAVAGVIGAMVTLAVILGIEALILLLGGLRVVSKKALRPASVAATSETGSGSAIKA